MNTVHQASTAPLRLSDKGIAWEAMPSLSHLLRPVRSARREQPAWEETRPADLDALMAIDPFEEPLEGLEIREVNEPEVFNALFGDARA